MTTARPLVKLIGTGGTISSIGHSSLDLSNYNSTGKRVTIDDLLAGIPDLDQFARVETEQFENINSNAMGPEHWLRLSKLVNVVFAKQPDVAGVAITHGTATLEDTAYFLNLTVKSDKPVAVTGSMRPASALGTDAHANIWDAIRVAASPDARGKGVMVVLNDEIHAAREVTKTDAHRLETFQTPHFGMLGYADADLRVVFYRQPVRKHTHQTEFNMERIDKLPRVDIVYSYAGADAAALNGTRAAGPDGLVLGGTGAGNQAPRWRRRCGKSPRPAFRWW
jgi:L-asparaginase